MALVMTDASNVGAQDAGMDRRSRFANRKQGTGREVTRRKWDLKGRRSGIFAKENVKRGSDGFDDLEDFWDDSGSTPGGASATESSVRRSARRTPPASSSSSSSSSSGSGSGSGVR